MDAFCNHTPLWNTSLTWESDWPEFTECFQNTALVWIASGWIWLTAPIYLPYLLSHHSDPNPVSGRLVAKLVLTALCFTVCVLEVTQGVIDLSKEGNYWRAYLVGPSIEGLTLILVFILILLERWKGFVTSGILFIFWTLSIVTLIIPFYSKIIKKEYSTDMLKFTVFFIYYFLVVIQWVLSCIADTPAKPWDEKVCPELKASFLSRITFWWLNKLMIQGYKNPLTEDNIFQLNPREKSRHVVPRFERNWRKEEIKLKSKMKIVPKRETNRNRMANVQEEYSEKSPLLGEKKPDSEKKVDNKRPANTPSLLKVLVKTFGLEFLHCQIFKLFYDACLFTLPQLLQLLIDFTQKKSDLSLDKTWKGYLLAAGFFVTVLIQSMMFQQLFYRSTTLSIRVRTALISAVYKKSLSMSNSARKESTVGEIVNLMSVDVEHLQNIIPYLWCVWSSPLQIGVALYFLYQTVGYSMFAGLGVMILLLPLNGFIMSKIHALQEKQMKQKDNRIKLLSEVLNGIKILKLYAWEMSFKEKILAIRNMELKILWKSNIIGCGFTFSWTVAPYVVSLATFATFIFTSSSHYLDAQTAFVAISLFNILRFAINLAPMIISEVVKASVSLRRLNKFLVHDDIDLSNVQHDYLEDHMISIKEGTFMWDPEIGPALKNINLGIPEGSLVAVVGQVGSGKSSIISAMLGEMIKVKGQVNVRGSVAYVPQQAWIQNASLQDNVLFGKVMDSDKYKEIIEACALKPDLDILPAGDKTEIGEKGINLSGGQKQRVSLARAVYHDSDIYYLDDPLSAVDSHVGKHIFEQVVGNKGLLRKKTRVLVTHGVQWLPRVDRIIVMVNGAVSEIGTYDELLDHAGAFAEFLQTYLTQEDSKEGEEEDQEAKEVKAQILQRLTSITSDDGSDTDGQTKKALKRQISRQMSTLEEKKTPVKEEKEEKPDGKEKLIEEEKAEVGSVKLAVFLSYAKAIGVWYFALVMLFYGCFQGCSLFSNVWLSEWTEDPTLINRSLGPPNSSIYREQNDYYLGIYGGLGIGQAICIALYAMIFVVRSINASKILHQKMLHNVVRSPMSFFDTTPSGRIVNRFSFDIDAIDNELPMQFEMFLDCLFIVVGTLIVISFSTPFFMILIVPLGFFYFLIQRFYVSTSRQLKRLESKTRSPIYSHFGETVAGASVIRAYGAQSEFVTASQHKVDANQQYQFVSFSANRWLGTRLEFLGNIVIMSAALFAVAARDSNTGISGGVVGLSISYALQITENLNWFVRMTSELETQIVCVERVQEYTERPVEADLINPRHRPPPGWPSKGAIHFRNYTTRYREGLDPVLKGIEAYVKPGEKIGIVGRTGAGKSSLALALFRLIEPTGGAIVVDDEDLYNFGLHDCRSKLTILPQEPVLFSGSLRMNLDPVDDYTDQELWTALEHAHLKSFVQGLPAKLEYDCGEGGQNFSVGQRQLLCLARSLLRKTKILVLDEATAAVDLETDDLIQDTIRKEFSECTVLTIAHRLNTVMDYDRIMVLQQGEIKEFDSPSVLLQNTDGIFYSLAKDAGLV